MKHLRIARWILCGMVPSSALSLLELAWKTMREYLLDQGCAQSIIKPFAFGMIEDSKVWLEPLNDRNLTSHVYDEDCKFLTVSKANICAVR